MKTFSFISILSIILLLIGVSFWKVRSQQKYTIDVSRAAVITQLKALNRYETTSFTIEKIIEAGTTQNNALTQFLYGDRILLIAHGEVIAGFDVSELSENDVTIDDRTISLTLPAAEILTTRLDSEKTRVYDRSKGLLNPGDKDLESEARIAAEQSIREAACQGGILDEATEKGRTQLETILKTIGFETVVVTIPVGSC